MYRPDHYLWKEETTLSFFKEDSRHLEDILAIFREEVERREGNGGGLVVPKVRIDGRSFRKEFTDVEVDPHNMRSDVFQENVTTAIDVILSLTDQGRITSELKWYESIGRARVVKSYWVEAIDKDEAQGRCGFVYEAGSPRYRFFQGNHIHLPADVRILNSPEYVEFFWLCL